MKSLLKYTLLIFGLLVSVIQPTHASDVIIVSTVQELMATSGPGQINGLTVLIKKGNYQLPRPIVIDGNRVTYKSISSNREDVILKGNGHNGNVPSIFDIHGSRVYIQSLSIGEVANHGIQIRGEKNSDHIFLKDLRLYDIKEQMVKGSYNKKWPDNHTDFGLIEGCLFEFTQGHSFQSYTGGIDIHRGENWVVKNNTFRNIRTLDGELTEGAIHFWTESRNTHILNNTIEYCDRGIMLGFDRTPHYGGFIKGNTIHVVEDTGIYICNAVDVFVEENKVHVDSDYPNAIEYRFKMTRDNLIRANETNRKIISRNGGQAIVISNRIDPSFSLKTTPSVSETKAMEPSEKAKPNAEAASREKQGTVVSGIRVFHHRGQTFISFTEPVNPFFSKTMTYGKFLAEKKEYENQYRFNLYRSRNPITSVRGLKPVASVGLFSGINTNIYGIHTGSRYGDSPLIRYVLKEGNPPLSPGKGVFVFNPPQQGKAYYAVIPVVRHREVHKLTPGENTTIVPVSESVGAGFPVHQRIERPKRFNYVDGAVLHFYTRWEIHPNTSVNGIPFDYLVAIPPNLKSPAPVGIHMHSWGGNLKSGYAWWTNASTGAILLASTQYPYDWWTGYREDYFGKKKNDAVIRPYTTNRLFSFLDFLAEASEWDIDTSRTFTAGVSMGGSGSIMAAIRYSGRVAWARSWVGIHKPDLSPRFKKSYEKVWGKPTENRLFENGLPVWTYYDDVAYLKRYPEKDIGFITFSNGKNDNGIGWEQAVLFYRMLQKTRRPHLFIWGQKGHGQRTIMPKNGKEATMPIDIAVNRSLPAFTNCSLDDNPGDGHPEKGTPAGQVNRWLYWETKDLVDEGKRWEITVGLTKNAPQDDCRVDITPRRLQRFKTSPGEVVYWENSSLSGQIKEQGRVRADSFGLITLEKISVGKNKNKIKLRKTE